MFQLVYRYIFKTAVFLVAMWAFVMRLIEALRSGDWRRVVLVIVAMAAFVAAVNLARFAGKRIREWNDERRSSSWG